MASLESIAAKKGCTSAQLILAWLLAQGEDIVAIPGKRNRDHLMENLGATEAELSAKEKAEIESVIPAEQVKGERYPKEGMKGING